jgi:mgtE-like transporter
MRPIVVGKAKMMKLVNMQEIKDTGIRLASVLNAIWVHQTSVFYKFFKTLEQSVIAYLFNMVGIAAGTIVAYHSGIFERIPWAITIYPVILSARGVIGGLFCGRLSTALYLGTIKPCFFGNTKSFYLLFQAIVFLTFEASLFLGVIAMLFRTTYVGLTGELLNMINVLMATMALALIIISPLTLTVSFVSFKHGLDPDIILYPVESTVSDVLITAVYVSMLNIYLMHYFSRYFLLIVDMAFLFASLYIFVKNHQEPEFTKTLREFLLTLILISFIVNTAGIVLGRINELIHKRSEIYKVCPVYIVYPALIDTIGDIGTVVGSTLTTKLALGTLKASFSSIRDHSTEILGAWAASLIMYFIYSLSALTIAGNLPNLAKFTMLLFAVNVLAAALIIMLSYTVAVITFQKGLDPDNFLIPIESSLADTLTTLSLFLALTIFGLV